MPGKSLYELNLFNHRRKKKRRMKLKESLWRRFLPHKQRKTRASYLSHRALFVYILLLTLSVGTIQLIRKTYPGVLGYASNINVPDLLKYTNEERERDGEAPLRLSPVLSRAAYEKAEHMFEHDYWAHIAPDGTSPWDFVLGVGYDYAYAGENLAKSFNTSEEVVEAWYRSASHRENLLSKNYDEVGFAVVNGVLEDYETTLVVQMFGRPQNRSLVTTPDQEERLLQSYATERPIGEEILVESEVLPAVDVTAVSKSISLAFALFLLALLILDVWYSKKHAIPKFTGHTLAHIIMVLFAIFSVWFVLSPGKVL